MKTISNLFKKERIVNKKLLKEYKNKKVYCEICGNSNTYLNHPHHIKPVGEGGDDVEDNLILLCTYKCHRQIHDYGLKRFAEENPQIVQMLLEKGWEFCDFTGRWINIKLQY